MHKLREMADSGVLAERVWEMASVALDRHAAETALVAGAAAAAATAVAGGGGGGSGGGGSDGDADGGDCRELQWWEEAAPSLGSGERIGTIRFRVWSAKGVAASGKLSVRASLRVGGGVASTGEAETKKGGAACVWGAAGDELELPVHEITDSLQLVLLDSSHDGAPKPVAQCVLPLLMLAEDKALAAAGHAAPEPAAEPQLSAEKAATLAKLSKLLDMGLKRADVERMAEVAGLDPSLLGQPEPAEPENLLWLKMLHVERSNEDGVLRSAVDECPGLGMRRPKAPPSELSLLRPRLELSRSVLRTFFAAEAAPPPGATFWTGAIPSTFEVGRFKANVKRLRRTFGLLLPLTELASWLRSWESFEASLTFLICFAYISLLASVWLWPLLIVVLLTAGRKAQLSVKGSASDFASTPAVILYDEDADPDPDPFTIGKLSGILNWLARGAEQLADGAEKLEMLFSGQDTTVTLICGTASIVGLTLLTAGLWVACYAVSFVGARAVVFLCGSGVLLPVGPGPKGPLGLQRGVALWRRLPTRSTLQHRALASQQFR